MPRECACFSRTPVDGSALCFVRTWIYRWKSSQHWRGEALKNGGEINWCTPRRRLPARHLQCVQMMYLFLLFSSFTPSILRVFFYIAIYVALYTRAYFIFTWVLTTSRGDLPLFPVRFRCPPFSRPVMYVFIFVPFSAPPFKPRRAWPTLCLVPRLQYVLFFSLYLRLCHLCHHPCFIAEWCTSFPMYLWLLQCFLHRYLFISRPRKLELTCNN